ncbi:hypothetical protein Pfo_015759 [Paulownia fortunei]|nr:hypothetical protein Pfo_015759 [Paulownia fortunei]
MAGNENRSGVTEDRGREPVQSQSKKKRDQSKSRESSSWERVMEDMGERLEIVKHNVETLEGHVLEQLDSLKENVQACLDADTLWDDRLTRLEAKVMDALQAMQISIETLREDLAVCKKTATTMGASTSVVSPRVDYPKPNRFDGRRDAKEVENFLWHMERYFEGLNLIDEASRVRTATLYLTDTAILWWRRKHADIERGTCRVDTWEDFKKELKRHFYPENIVYEARKKLRELKQRGTIREYDDLLFHFVDGLQQWAKQELHRQDVKSVDEAIAVAESLTEYQPQTDASKKKEKNPSRKEYEEKKRAFVPKGGCFVCKGPHAMSNCPKLGSLSAMVERNEAAATMDEGTSNIRSIRLLNALNAKPLPATSSNGLIHVEAYISGKPTKALVDTGATHNFITEEEANRLGLRLKNVELRLGTWKGQVDFSVAPMDDFKVVLGMDFLRKVTAIPMPSFSSVCILEKGAPCMIPTIDPIEGHSQGTKAESRQLSAMQITKGVKRGEPTYLATLKEEVPAITKEEDLPPIIQNVLEENKDVMPDELPKKLPPRREVDHKIELESGTKPPAMAPYPRWQDFLAEFDYTLEYKPGKANVVADALSRKVELAADPLARELKKLEVEGKTKQFWVEDGLLYTKGRRLYVPKWGSLRKELIKECHDTKWADSVELYVKTCLVCQQDKVETKQPVGLDYRSLKQHGNPQKTCGNSKINFESTRRRGRRQIRWGRMSHTAKPRPDYCSIFGLGGSSIIF